MMCRMPAGVLPGLEPLFMQPTDPRYNGFHWETWHELDVLRPELAPRFVRRTGSGGSGSFRVLLRDPSN
jgi:hypothetical protein